MGQAPLEGQPNYYISIEQLQKIIIIGREK